METYYRIFKKKIEVEELVFKKGDKCLTGEIDKDENVVVFKKYWFKIPVTYFIKTG